MAQEKNNKPKLDLEKMVQQFNLLGAIETKNPNVIKDVFNNYTFNNSENNEFKKYFIDGLTANGSANDFSMNFVTSLANTYYDSKAKAKIGEIKQVYERSGYKIPKMDNIISNNTPYKQILIEAKKINLKKEESELKGLDYKLSKEEEKLVTALKIIEDIEKICKSKIILNYSEIQKNKDIERINEQYKPKKDGKQTKNNSINLEEQKAA